MNELISVLQPVRRYWYAILLAALLGAGAVGALAYPPSESYRSAALVNNDPTAGGNERFDFIRDLDQALSTRSVLEQLSEETGVPADVLSNSLEATQAGDSGFTRVVFETDERLAESAAERVITRGPELAAQFVVKGRVELAERVVTQAERARNRARTEYTAAEQAVNAQLADNEFVAPDLDYAATQSDLRDLRNEIQTLATDAPEREALQDEIDALETELPDAAQAANEYTRAVRERENALATLNGAEQALVDARRERAAAAAIPIVTPQTIEQRTSGTRSYAMTVVAGGLAAAVVATALLAWILQRHAVRDHDARLAGVEGRP